MILPPSVRSGHWLNLMKPSSFFCIGHGHQPMLIELIFEIVKQHDSRSVLSTRLPFGQVIGGHLRVGLSWTAFAGTIGQSHVRLRRTVSLLPS